MRIDAPVPEAISEDFFNVPMEFSSDTTYQVGGALKPGDAILYEVAPDRYFGGFVDSVPFWFGLTLCVSLRGMAPEYAAYKGGPDPTRVKAAPINLCYRELKQ